MKAPVIVATAALLLSSLAFARDDRRVNGGNVREATPKPFVSREQLVGKLHQKNLKYIELGNLARTTGSSSVVRAFGQQLVTEHEKLDAQVNEYAKANNLTLVAEEISTAPAKAALNQARADVDQGGGAEVLPGGIPQTTTDRLKDDAPVSIGIDEQVRKDQKRAELDALRTTTGPDFDRQFFTVVRETSSDMVKVLTNARLNTTDKKLTQLIDRAIGTYKAHARDLEKIAGAAPRS